MLRENTLALRRQLSSNFSQRPGSLDRATLHVCVRPTADTMFESSRNYQPLPPVCWCLRLFACVAVFALLLGTLWLLFWFPSRSLFSVFEPFFRLPFHGDRPTNNASILFLKDVQRQSSFLVPFTFTLFPVFEAFFSGCLFSWRSIDEQTSASLPLFSKMYSDSPFW